MQRSHADPVVKQKNVALVARTLCSEAKGPAVAEAARALCGEATNLCRPQPEPMASKQNEMQHQLNACDCMYTHSVADILH